MNPLKYCHRNKEIDSISKTTYLITLHLLDSVNATSTFLVENTWGYVDPKTGYINGMTGRLVRGEVEIGGNC